MIFFVAATNGGRIDSIEVYFIDALICSGSTTGFTAFLKFFNNYCFDVNSDILRIYILIIITIDELFFTKSFRFNIIK